MEFTEEEKLAIRKYKKAKTDVWRKKNPEQWNSYSKAWKEKNKDYVRDYNREWYLKNKERRALYNRNWYLKHKEQFNEAVRATNAKKKYPGWIDAKIVREIIEREKRTCYWCKKENLTGRDLTLEHLQRNNNPESIVLACFSCNAARLSPVARRENQYTKI